MHKCQDKGDKICTRSCHPGSRSKTSPSRRRLPVDPLVGYSPCGSWQKERVVLPLGTVDSITAGHSPTARSLAVVSSTARCHATQSTVACDVAAVQARLVTGLAMSLSED